jgi:hypothetical protein
LSIGPSFNSTNANGEIALGCGATGGSSLIIDDFGATVLAVPLPKATDETWYDPASNHFFFAQSGTGPASGWLGVVDAGKYPPLSFVQEDGDAGAGGPPVQDPIGIAATGSHSVAVFPGTCGSSSDPARLSRVYVPTRSTLTTPNNGSTICSSFGGSDTVGCIAVFTAPATFGITLARKVVIPLSVVNRFFPEITREASTGRNSNAIGNPKATRIVIYTTGDGSKKVTISVDQYGSSKDAASAYQLAVEKSQSVPGFKPVAVPNLGQQTFAGTVTMGSETHVGLGVLNDTLIVGVTLAGYDATADNIANLVAMARTEIAVAKMALGGSC